MSNVPLSMPPPAVTLRLFPIAVFVVFTTGVTIVLAALITCVMMAIIPAAQISTSTGIVIIFK